MARNPRYIDLHCHPEGKAFNFLRNSSSYNKDRYHPWTVILSNFRHQAKGKRAFSYAQCDMVKLWNGNGAVIFASLYPFEKGFFTGGGRADKQAVNRILSLLDKVPLLDPVFDIVFRRAVRPIVSSEEGVTSAKDHFQSLLMRLPMDRVNYIQSSAYDYYEELLEEYRFLRLRDGIPTEPPVFGTALQRLRWKLFPKKSAKDSTEAIGKTGTYIIAKNYADVTTALAGGKLVLILTIEGMHALGTDTHLPELFNRIGAMKKWEHPVFFITFAHHFNNFLCGHAHSMPKQATLFVDQTTNMQRPFSAIGMAALRYLLSLAPDNTKNTAALGRRILIDVKHMGATSRKQFYQEVVGPCLAAGDVIPVIASHVGYTGVSRISDLEKAFADGKEIDDYQVRKGLNAWNINVCNEDIEWIVRTGGLLGLCLDQRIMGFYKRDNRSSAVLAWNNLRSIIDAVITSPDLSQGEKQTVWSVLCLGTDFEGYIDPADGYPTALQFGIFEQDLAKSIQSSLIDTGLSQRYFIMKPASELAADICMNNAMKFLEKHFQDETIV